MMKFILILLVVLTYSTCFEPTPVEKSNRDSTDIISPALAIAKQYPDTFFTLNKTPFTIDVNSSYVKLGSRRYYDLVFPYFNDDTLKKDLGIALEINSRLSKRDSLFGEFSVWVDSTGKSDVKIKTEMDTELDKTIVTVIEKAKFVPAYHRETGLRIGYGVDIKIEIDMHKK
jgi:hypothetical protein